MKNMAISAAILSALIFTSGCQDSDSGDASAENQGAGDQVAMNDGGAAPGGGTSEGGEMGDMMGSDDEMYGCGDEAGAGDPCMEEQYGADYGEAGFGADGECPEAMAEGDYDQEYGAGPEDPEMEMPCGEEGYGADYGAEGDLEGAGGPGEGYGDGGGSGGPPQTKEGTALHAVVQTILAISQGKQEGLNEFISARAKGTLAELRSGKMPKEKFETLKNEIGRVKLLSPKGTRLSLINEEGRILRFTCKKEDGKYVISEFSNKAPTKRSKALYNKKK